VSFATPRKGSDGAGTHSSRHPPGTALLVAQPDRILERDRAERLETSAPLGRRPGKDGGTRNRRCAGIHGVPRGGGGGGGGAAGAGVGTPHRGDEFFPDPGPLQCVREGDSPGVARARGRTPAAHLVRRVRHRRGGVLHRHRVAGGIPRAVRRPGADSRHRSPSAVPRHRPGGDLPRRGVAERSGSDQGDVFRADEGRPAPGGGCGAAADRIRGPEPDRFPLRTASPQAVCGDLLQERDDLLPVGHHPPARGAVPRNSRLRRGPLPRTLRDVVGDHRGVPAGAAGESVFLPEDVRGTRYAPPRRRAPLVRNGRVAADRPARRASSRARGRTFPGDETGAFGGSARQSLLPRPRSNFPRR